MIELNSPGDLHSMLFGGNREISSEKAKFSGLVSPVSCFQGNILTNKLTFDL